jgi:hypothetical protein
VPLLTFDVAAVTESHITEFGLQPNLSGDDKIRVAVLLEMIPICNKIQIKKVLIMMLKIFQESAYRSGDMYSVVFYDTLKSDLSMVTNVDFVDNHSDDWAIKASFITDVDADDNKE